jgi:hypothetical protein
MAGTELIIQGTLFCCCRPCHYLHTYLLTYLLTELSSQLCSHSRTLHHFMEPEGSSPFHKSPPLVPILSQIDPVHTIPSYLSKIHFIIVHPLNEFLFSPIRATCPAHFILLDLIILIMFDERVQVMKLLIMQFSPISRHFISLRTKYSPQHPVLKYTG